jgi:hypothetical protein
VTLNAKELDVMKHALGWPRMYRNHFVTGPGSDDYDTWEALVAKGLATKQAGNPLSGGDPCFFVTVEGKNAIAAAAG